MLDLLPPDSESVRSTVGTICIDLKASTLGVSVGEDVTRLQQAILDSSIDHTKRSTEIGHISETGRLVTPASGFLTSLNALLAKLDPIAKIIDDMSRVSRCRLIPLLTCQLRARFTPTLMPRGKLHPHCTK